MTWTNLSYNCGIVGGAPAAVLQYAKHAIESVNTFQPMPTWAEQATLGKFHAYVETLFENDDSKERRGPLSEGSGYVHLMEGKALAEVQFRVVRRLNREAPEIAKRLGCLTVDVDHSKRLTASDVRDFYKHRTPKRRPLPNWTPIDPSRYTLTVPAGGIGDVTMLTGIEATARNHGKKAHVRGDSPHYSHIMRFCPDHTDDPTPYDAVLFQGLIHHGLGAGHNFQRAQRWFGFPVDAIPKGNLVVKNVERKANRICIHTTPGRHATGWQSEFLHPRARMLYPDTLSAINEVARNRRFTFIEVGSKRTLHHPRIEDGTGDSVERMIRIMAECEYHLGVLSGPTHIAAALGLKVITIINFPHPGMLMLPNLIDTGVVEEEWLYPQSAVLHQDEDSRHWPKLTGAKTILAALNGEVYPYWDNSILTELALWQ